MKKFLILLAALFIGTAVADTVNINWYVDGSTYNTSTCTVGGDVTLPTAPTKRGYTFRGWIPRYTPIEYIESTGTQYIDTGFKPNNNTRAVAEFMLQAVLRGWLFMARNGGGNSSFGLLGAGDGDIRTDYGNTSITGPSMTNFSNKKLRVDKNKNITTIYDNAGTSLWDATNATNTFQSNYNMYVFAGNSDDVTPSSLEGMRIYSFQLYDNGTLIRDMIPVLDGNNVPCMFDRVTYAFFYNAGTGDFVAGPVISNQ